MLCRLHTVYKIIHCVALHTLCNITRSVSNHTVKWSIFCVTSRKIYICQKKITRGRAPPVAPVTNIRYAYGIGWFFIVLHSFPTGQLASEHGLYLVRHLSTLFMGRWITRTHGRRLTLSPLPSEMRHPWKRRWRRRRRRKMQKIGPLESGATQTQLFISGLHQRR